MGTLNLIRPSVPLSVCPSVTKTLTLAITFALLQIELWYLACVFLVTRPFRWYHVVTLTVTFDLLQGQICCRAGDHSSLNLLVLYKFYIILSYIQRDIRVVSELFDPPTYCPVWRETTKKISTFAIMTWYAQQWSQPKEWNVGILKWLCYSVWLSIICIVYFVWFLEYLALYNLCRYCHCPWLCECIAGSISVSCYFPAHSMKNFTCRLWRTNTVGKPASI